MTAQEYLGLLRRGWITIVAALLAGLAIAGVVTLATPASYSSTVTFYISTTQSSSPSSTDAYQGSLLSQERVKSYTQLLSSYRLGDEIVRDLGLAAAPQDVADEVTASISPDTVLLTAEVTDRSPERAQAIAGALTRAFPTVVASLEKPANSTLPPAVTAQVVQGPLPSDGPVAPEVALYLVVGAVAGLLVGVAVVVLRRTLDRRVRSVETLHQVFPEPLLGALMFDKSVAESPLFVRERPRAPISEHIRTIRTTFELFNFDGEARCHVVTSAVENEGKSTVLVNLALAEADAGRRVLVIEADLRKPQAAAYLGLPGGVGLTQVLGGKVGLAGAVQTGPSPRLWCLAAGPLPPNPYEMLQSDRMGALLAEARRSYDTVLIDAPPLLPVADGLELARQADGVLCVVRARFAPAATIRRAHALLGTTAIRHVGVVFNAVTAADESSYAEYYTAYGATPTPTDGPQVDARSPSTSVKAPAHAQLSPDGRLPMPAARPTPRPRREDLDLDAPTVTNGRPVGSVNGPRSGGGR